MGAPQWIRSSFTGAPALDNAAGTLISVLDACLINGFDSKTLTSLSVSSGVATATISGGHSYQVRATVLIEGATPSELNGRKRIISTTSTTFTFSSVSSDQTATGTITSKIAPLSSWSKAFSGTNKAAYQSTHVDATGYYLRVLDTATYPTYTGRVAQYAGYEAMTDIDTGTNRFPTTTQLTDGLLILKSYHTDGTDSPWEFIGDELGFYLFVTVRSGYKPKAVLQFGDLVADSSNDVHLCGVHGIDSVSTTYPPEFYGDFVTGVNSSASNPGFYLARSYTGSPGAVQGGKLNLTAVTGSITYQDGNNIPYPFPIDSGIRLSEVLVHENPTTNVGVPRGKMPGMYALLHRTPLTDLTVIDSITGLSGEELLDINVYGASTWVTDANDPANNSSYGGGCCIGIKNDWR